MKALRPEGSKHFFGTIGAEHVHAALKSAAAATVDVTPIPAEYTIGGTFLRFEDLWNQTHNNDSNANWIVRAICSAMPIQSGDVR